MDRVNMESHLDAIYFGTNADRIGYELHRFQIEPYMDRACAINNLIDIVSEFARIGSESNRLRIGWYLDRTGLQSNCY